MRFSTILYWSRLGRAGRALYGCTKGQDMVEYALIAGFVSVMMGAMLPSQFVPFFSNIYQMASNHLTNAASQAST